MTAVYFLSFSLSFLRVHPHSRREERGSGCALCAMLSRRWLTRDLDGPFHQGERCSLHPGVLRITITNAFISTNDVFLQ